MKQLMMSPLSGLAACGGDSVPPGTFHHIPWEHVVRWQKSQNAEKEEDVVGKMKAIEDVAGETADSGKPSKAAETRSDFPTIQRTAD